MLIRLFVTGEKKDGGTLDAAGGWPLSPDEPTALCSWQGQLLYDDVTLWQFLYLLVDTVRGIRAKQMFLTCARK